MNNNGTNVSEDTINNWITDQKLIHKVCYFLHEVDVSMEKKCNHSALQMKLSLFCITTSKSP